MGTRLAILLWPLRMASRAVKTVARRIIPDPDGVGPARSAQPADWNEGAARRFSAETGGGAYIKPAEATDGARGESLTISQLEVRERLGRKEALILLDVREPHEFDQGYLPGAVSMPLATVGTRFQELDPGHTIIAYCASGVRSVDAARALRELGFPRVHSLAGGLGRWLRDGGTLERPGRPAPGGEGATNGA